MNDYLPTNETRRVGVYMTRQTFDEARSAYLADWLNGGTADTFARWIAQAIDTHASRTPAQRAARDRLPIRQDERTGMSKSFNIPVATILRMQKAITADQLAGRWPSHSAWSVEAITIATEDARETNGGQLPPPPTRLPNKLTR